ncbi:MAG: LysR family transcriptional regulator [Solobacterium sp.]|nr:LysR family transcriptional regulator [Solobacterium sp.]MBR0479449.1 LysR family transcriptional regulator [Solobacterium sp.]
MNIKQAEYLLVLKEEGSITAAARRLYISQPALSQTIRQMEDDLGVQIIDRSTTPYRFTEAGTACLSAAEELLDLHDHLYNRLKRIRDNQEGTLRLGISVQRSMQILPSVLPEFMSAWPYVTIQLTEQGSTTLEELLLDGKLDLALAVSEPVNPLIRYDLIESETIGVLAGRDSALAKNHAKDTVTAADLQNETFVNLRHGHSVRVIQDKLFHESGISPKILLETDSFELCKRIALETGTCMISSDIFVDDYARSRGVFFPIENYENHRHFYACSMASKSLPGYARDLIDICRKVIQQIKNGGYTE